MAVPANVRKLVETITGPTPTTYLLGNGKFSWNGKIHYLPKDIAEGGEIVQNCFIHILRLVKDDIYYMRGIPKDPAKFREFALKRAAEKIKDIPPDPFFFRVYAVAQTAVIVFLIAIAGKQLAKL
jgi:hypothetical protein